MTSIAGLSLNAVRRQFDRRALRAVDADFLHREIEQRMFERLDLVRISPSRILDAGCGYGAGMRTLGERYPQALVVGADLSPATAVVASRLAHSPAHPTAHPTADRVTRAHSQNSDGLVRGWLGRMGAAFGVGSSQAPTALSAMSGSAAEPRACVISADTQALPLANSRFDLVWSNLALHWCPDPGLALAEWSRVLRADGLLMFSAYGVDTLRELRALGWTTQRFPDLHDLGDALIRTGFSAPVMDMEPIRLTWMDPWKAWSDLRALGGNALEARGRGLRGRRCKQRWLDALEQARDASGAISVTIEVVYGHAWCAPASKLERGTARIEFVRPAR